MISIQELTANESRRHELLLDAAEKVALRLIEQYGVPEESAIDIGNELADYLSEMWGGQDIYFAKDQTFKLSQRDWEIFGEMERGNARDLAKKHGISKVRVYQIYKRCLTEYRRLTQHTLFPAEEKG